MADRIIDLRTRGRTYREIADEVGLSIETVRDRLREFTEPRYTFGETVRELRKARGWSQEDLARFMTDAGYSMHQTTVAKMESGARPTSVDELVALSRVIDVPPARLVPPEDDARGSVRESLSRLQAINAELRATETEVARLQQRQADLVAERQRAFDDYFTALRKVRVAGGTLFDAAEHVRVVAEMEHIQAEQAEAIIDEVLALRDDDGVDQEAP